MNDYTKSVDELVARQRRPRVYGEQTRAQVLQLVRAARRRNLVRALVVCFITAAIIGYAAYRVTRAVAR